MKRNVLIVTHREDNELYVSHGINLLTGETIVMQNVPIWEASSYIWHDKDSGEYYLKED